MADADKKFKGIAGDEGGAALVYILGIILVMSILATAMLNLTTTATLGHLSSNETEQAYFMAEAGLNYALPLVKADIEADAEFNDDAGLDGQTFTLDNGGIQNGQFMITVDDDNPDQTIITSTGSMELSVSVKPQSSLTLALSKTINQGDSGIVDRALFSNGKITLGDNVRIKGEMGTNGDTIEQGKWVFIIDKKGHWVPIDESEVTNAGMKVDPMAFSCSDCSKDITLEQWFVDLSSGTYEARNLDVEENTQVTITGDVVFKVAQDFNVAQNVFFNIKPGASLTFYVDSSVEIRQNFQITFPEGEIRPEAFVIYGTENADTIEIARNAQFKGVVYAPGANITAGQNGNYIGALVGNELNLGKNLQMRWDPDAESVITPGSGGVNDTAVFSNPSQYYSN